MYLNILRFKRPRAATPKSDAVKAKMGPQGRKTFKAGPGRRQQASKVKAALTSAKILPLTINKCKHAVSGTPSLFYLRE